MTEQYRELKDSIAFDPDPKDKELIKRKRMTEKVLIGISLVSAALTGAFFLTDFRLKNTFIFVTLILLVALYLYAKGISVKATAILQDKCDPVGYLSYYAALLENAGRRSDWGAHFYNVGAALCYAGRWDDARAVLDLFSHNITDNKALFRYRLLANMLAFHDGNKDEMMKQLGKLKGTRAAIDTTGELEKLYQQGLQMPIQLDILEKKDYRMGFEAFKDTEKSEKRDDTMLDQVNRSFFLYKLAKGMQDDYLTCKYGSFVGVNGGTMDIKNQIEL